MKNFNIFGVHDRIRFLGGGFTKNQYIGGLPKRGETWIVGRFKGGLARKRVVVFLRWARLIPQCTLWLTNTWSKLKVETSSWHADYGQN